MAFTFDPASGDNRSRVRLLIHDVQVNDETRQLFTDAEIDLFLTMESSEVFQAAATACHSLAAAGAGSAVVYRASRLLDIDRTKVPEHYRELAKEYRARATEGAVFEEIDSLDYERDPFGADVTEYIGDFD